MAVRANKLDLVERLADDLAHEIKNPLHSMVINLEVLRRRIVRAGGESTEELMRYAGIINGELERVNGRIELLLQLVRPDRTGEPVSLAAILGELLDLVELERDRRGIGIEYEPAPQQLRGRLHRETARQLTLNLLVTALDSTPTGGTIRITAESYQDAERLELKLSSPADEAGAIQVVSSRLVVARALAEALGGSLEVHAAGAAGTSLLLTLPAAAG